MITPVSQVTTGRHRPVLRRPIYTVFLPWVGCDPSQCRSAGAARVPGPCLEHRELGCGSPLSQWPRQESLSDVAPMGLAVRPLRWAFRNVLGGRTGMSRPGGPRSC